MHAGFHNADVQGGGGGVRYDPPAVSKLSVVRLSEKKTADCSRQVLAIGGALCDRRSIFEPVMRGQTSNFR